MNPPLVETSLWRLQEDGQAKVSLFPRSNGDSFPTGGHVELTSAPPSLLDSYRALGLMPNLNPRQAGGIEPIEATPFALRQQTAYDMQDLEMLNPDDDDDDELEIEEPEEVEEEAVPPVASTSKLGKGLARIVRDENGKVVGFVTVGEDGGEVEEKVVAPVRKDDEEGEDSDEDGDESDEDEAAANDEGKKPWGNGMAEWSGEESDAELEDELVDEGPRSTGQGIPLNAKKTRVLAKTDVVRELEHLAAQETKVVRHTSEFEYDWLVSLVVKYGEDVDRMTRDRKANVWQKTAGEIKRA